MSLISRIKEAIELFEIERKFRIEQNAEILALCSSTGKKFSTVKRSVDMFMSEISLLSKRSVVIFDQMKKDENPSHRGLETLYSIYACVLCLTSCQDSDGLEKLRLFCNDLTAETISENLSPAAQFELLVNMRKELNDAVQEEEEGE